MKKLAFFSLILVLGANYFFWTKGQSSPEISTAKASIPQMATDRFPVKLISAEKTETASAAEEPVAEAREVLWVESELAKEILHENGRLPVDLNSETYLELDVERLRSLEIGDYVDIALPGIEGSYDGQVGDVKEHASGNKSVQLNFPGLTRLHGATFTLGKNSVYAQLNMPSGSYTMEAQDGYAWIAPNGALIQNHEEKHDKDMSSEAPREKTWNDDEVPLNNFE